MPLNILGAAVFDGVDSIPYLRPVLTWSPYLAFIGAIKYWSGGPSNTWERNLHGKLYIVTGGTTQSMGTSVVLDMARRGAQMIVLCRKIDEWSEEWCEQMRELTGNELIYLEQCDLSDLFEVRKFATKWLDNAPPRRLDGIIVMSGDCEPWGLRKKKTSTDGIEIQMATNYAGVFHLLNLMKPSFKAQPPDRDVRIIVTTCFLQAMGKCNVEDPLWLHAPFKNSRELFSSSKLQLSLAMLHLQRLLITEAGNSAKDGRSGKNVTVTVVQPGLMRSPSLRRVVSNGSVLLLLILYCVILYPFLWLLTKSGYRGAQTIIYSITTPELEEVNRTDDEVKYIANCSIVNFARKEFYDKELQEKLYENTIKQIESVEKKMAAQRNQASKKETKDQKKNTKPNPKKASTKKD
ncbi:putative oxidoreductase [Kluyveromyces lactis]|uniref:KLLA0D08349p n=1 Tax=Kluyveromyces lactis (strain ATCC 8585 / CBS 2359 / DSM 70799 / NBRC 1267 / NRRL Y-1140 / WM37) TaxID=284590 RepID=Q6CRK5_KLULA|nr:uncharacterized protein KLLA0_D08349g [Kluyveromyces lactis]CAH00530.1 KLLA0D08349p [Kluyveromyces lactis]|eukprot:XP_453434.1 uncharacterized protein KLLA0_D08349g [Kluyveromyces lactis]